MDIEHQVMNNMLSNGLNNPHFSKQSVLAILGRIWCELDHIVVDHFMVLPKAKLNGIVPHTYNHRQQIHLKSFVPAQFLTVAATSIVATVSLKQLHQSECLKKP